MEKIVAGLFGLALGIVGVLVGFIQLRSLSALASWKSVGGKIVERGTFRITHATRSAPAFQHSPLVKYVYQVDGREYISDSILPKHIQTPEHNTIEWAEKKAASFPEDVTVYYNPESPQDSFLVRTSKTKLYFLIGFSSVAALIGALFLLAAVSG